MRRDGSRWDAKGKNEKGEGESVSATGISKVVACDIQCIYMGVDLSGQTCVSIENARQQNVGLYM
jgi:hypothetical protein